MLLVPLKTKVRFSTTQYILIIFTFRNRQKRLTQSAISRLLFLHPIDSRLGGGLP